MHLPAFTAPEEVRDVTLAVGGSGGATSIAMRRLGNEVLLIGRVGADLAGNFLVHRLRQFGVDLHVKVLSRMDTAIHVVAVDETGDARYVATQGADLSLGRFQSPSANQPLDIDLADRDVLHIGNVEQFSTTNTTNRSPVGSTGRGT